MNTIKDLCRFCTKIIQEKNTNVFFLNQNIIEIITSLFNFDDKVYLYENDQLPVKICSDCYSSLMKLYSFKIKCEDVCKYWKDFLISKIKSEGAETVDNEIIENINITISNNVGTAENVHVFDDSCDEDPLKINLNDIKSEDVDPLDISVVANTTSTSTSTNSKNRILQDPNISKVTKKPKRKRKVNNPVQSKTALDIPPHKEKNTKTCPIKYSMEDVKFKAKIVKCVLLDFKNPKTTSESNTNTVQTTVSPQHSKKANQRKTSTVSNTSGGDSGESTTQRQLTRSTRTVHT